MTTLETEVSKARLSSEVPKENEVSKVQVSSVVSKEIKVTKVEVASRVATENAVSEQRLMQSLAWSTNGTLWRLQKENRPEAVLLSNWLKAVPDLLVRHGSPYCEQ